MSMAFKDFMNSVRYWDNLAAKWLMRHFYFTFFQIVLVVVFVFWFINLFNTIDINVSVAPTNLTQKILISQSVNSTIIVFLLLLNSFWLLFMFNTLQRLLSALKDINFNLSRRNPKD